MVWGTIIRRNGYAVWHILRPKESLPTAVGKIYCSDLLREVSIPKAFNFR